VRYIPLANLIVRLYPDWHARAESLLLLLLLLFPLLPAAGVLVLVLAMLDNKVLMVLASQK